MQARLLILAAALFVASCDSAKRRASRRTPNVTTAAPLPDRRVFFQDILAKRLGRPRESRKSFVFPTNARPPFVLMLDYDVDRPGAVSVEIDGSPALEGPAFDTSSVPPKPRRLEREIALSVLEEHDVFTVIASPFGGYARIQLVGTLVDR
jgi:hypothetical protein